MRAAGDADDASRDAMGELCEAYWYPIYSYVRRRGNDHHDAVDLTQGFFTHLLENDSLARAHPDRGRFRAFLLASVKNFMTSTWRTNTTARRGGCHAIVSVDDEAFQQQYQSQLANDFTPETLFERSWVESLLRRAVQRLSREYGDAGKSELFDAVDGYLVASSEKVPQAQIADQLGMTAPAVAMSIHRIRQRYAQLVRDEIGNTVADPADIDDELGRLMAVMSST